MKLDWAMLADAAQVRDGVAYVIGGGIDTVNTPSLPAVFNAAILLRFLLHRLETDRPHVVELRINDEDGKELAKAQGTFFASASPDTPVGWDIPAVFALNIAGLPLAKDCRYAVEILADGGYLKTLNFRVRVNPALAPPFTPPSTPG
jgi:hypothetical protein